MDVHWWLHRICKLIFIVVKVCKSPLLWWLEMDPRRNHSWRSRHLLLSHFSPVTAAVDDNVNIKISLQGWKDKIHACDGFCGPFLQLALNALLVKLWGSFEDAADCSSPPSSRLVILTVSLRIFIAKNQLERVLEGVIFFCSNSHYICLILCDYLVKFQRKCSSLKLSTFICESRDHSDACMQFLSFGQVPLHTGCTWSLFLQSWIFKITGIPSGTSFPLWKLFYCDAAASAYLAFVLFTFRANQINEEDAFSNGIVRRRAVIAYTSRGISSHARKKVLPSDTCLKNQCFSIHEAA